MLSGGCETRIANFALNKESFKIAGRFVIYGYLHGIWIVGVQSKQSINSRIIDERSSIHFTIYQRRTSDQNEAENGIITHGWTVLYDQ